MFYESIFYIWFSGCENGGWCCVICGENERESFFNELLNWVYLIINLFSSIEF